MSFLFHQNHDVSVVEPFTADGTSALTTTAIDMAGYDQLTLAIVLGDVDAAAVLTCAVFTVATNAVTGGAAVTLTDVSATGGVITSGNLVLTEDSGNLDNKVVTITIDRSVIASRYVYMVITPTVESLELGCVLAIRSCARDLPVTQGSTNIGYAFASA
jgi:hypothetical protein